MLLLLFILRRPLRAIIRVLHLKFDLFIAKTKMNP